MGGGPRPAPRSLARSSHRARRVLHQPQAVASFREPGGLRGAPRLPDPPAACGDPGLRGPPLRHSRRGPPSGRARLPRLLRPCHGVFDSRRPLRPGIVLAPEPGSAPRGEAPVLTAEDVLGMEIRADLVALSACESGVNEHRPGDELIGLTRAWIYAGTPSVLATLWPVNDLSSQLLM